MFRIIVRIKELIEKMSNNIRMANRVAGFNSRALSARFSM